MHSLNKQREAQLRLMSKLLGVDYKFLRAAKIEHGMATRGPDLMRLPSKLTNPVMCFKQGSANFGKRFFVAGLDSVGDPEHPLGPC